MQMTGKQWYPDLWLYVKVEKTVLLTAENKLFLQKNELSKLP